MIEIPEEVKRQYRSDKGYKNMRIHFINEEREDITNENIIGESVILTESMCQQDNLKFGLCEAGIFECEVAGITENLKGYKIKVTQEITYEDAEGMQCVYTVPYGIFTIDSCKRQADMTRRKIIAYDALYGGNLDNDETNLVNDIIQKPYNYTGAGEAYKEFATANLYLIKKVLMERAGIKLKYEKKPFLKSNNNGYWTEENILYLNDAGNKRVRAESVKVQFERDMTGLYYGDGYAKINIFTSAIEKRKEKILIFLKNNSMEELEVITAVNSGKIAYSMLGIDKNMYVPLDITNNSELSFLSDFIDLCIVHTVHIEILQQGKGWEIKNSLKLGLEESVNLLINNQEVYEIIMPLEERKQIVSNKRYEGITARKLLESLLELNAAFGVINRETGAMESRRIDNAALYPAEDLFPSENLFPSGPQEVMLKSAYKELQYEEYTVQPIGKINAIYKTLDQEGSETTAVYSYIFNPNHKNVYNIEDNWLLQSTPFTEAEIKKIIEIMASKVGNTAFTPLNAVTKGLPFLQAGDCINFITVYGNVQTYILKRTLKGIQSLSDTLEAYGIKQNADISTGE